ncbi:MAG: DUF5715 family protein [Acidobacteriota bacterium]
MQRGALILLAAAAIALFTTTVAMARTPSLRPSRTALERQYRAAKEHRFSFLATASEVDAFVRGGMLVELHESHGVRLKENVALPYARPEIVDYVERLGAYVRGQCGEPLVVTSLVRPLDRQPWNSSHLSVHPAGMAIDLRIPAGHCRRVLESSLLADEEAGFVEAARERHPPHYHVVVFPRAYNAHLLQLDTDDSRREVRHRVRRGESLWSIAKRYDTTVGSLRRLNQLRSTTIRPGQILTVPRRR